MGRAKCEICGVELEHFRDFEGTPLCEEHAVMIHQFIEHLKKPVNLALMLETLNFLNSATMVALLEGLKK